MSPVPMLQIAMDYITLPPALAMAVKVAPEVDIIEIGTPLCKAAGSGSDPLDARDRARQADPGGLQVAGCGRAGSQDGLRRRRGHDDRDRRRGAGDRGAGARHGPQDGQRDADGAHRRARHHRPGQGVARRSASSAWSTTAAGTSRPPTASGRRTTARRSASSSTWASRSRSPAASRLRSCPSSSRSPVSVVICGRGIRETADPRASAHEFRAEMQRLWGGGETVTPSYAGGKAAATSVGRPCGQGGALGRQRDGACC